MAFADNLKQLPSVEHIAGLQLLGTAGQPAVLIENKPGQAGALAVYAALAAKYGCINSLAAREGLELFAEHTSNARAHPGSHPNIDRLLAVIASGEILTVKVISA